jgi:uncharacterized protein
MNLNFSTTTTTHKNSKSEWVVYNWLNSSYAVLYELDHPLYKHLESTGDCKQPINADNFITHPDDLEYLIENQILIENNLIIKDQITSQFNKSRENGRSLSLILLPAGEACNFNCVYCYEDHSQKARMTAVHEQAIEKLVKNTDANVVQIEYFGGEPLLNLKFILGMNQRMLIWAESKNKTFISSATTNGYLLDPEALEKLYAAHVRHYQITLDGLAQHHNKLRPLVNGKGTFERIVSNLKNIVSRQDLTELRVMIRVNYNESTSSPSDINAYLDFISDMIEGDTRFSIIFRGIGDYSASNNRAGDKDCLCSKVSSDRIQRAYESGALARDFSLGDSTLYLNFGASSCYAAKPNNFVISPDWTIKKCTVALTSSVNNVGYLEETGVISFNENYDKWIEPRLYSKDECTKCHFIAQCHGNSCPLHNIEQNISVCPPQKFIPIRIVDQFILQADNHE